MTWIMVMWITTGNVAGTFSSALSTLPVQFLTEAACEASGRALTVKSARVNYACVPVNSSEARVRS